MRGLISFNYTFFSPMTFSESLFWKSLIFSPTVWNQSKNALDSANRGSDQLLRATLKSYCKIAISPLVSKQFSNGLHCWIWNWEKIISSVKKILNFKGYISGGQKNPTLSRYTLVLQKSLEAVQDVLKLDNNFHIFIRKRQFETLSVLEVWWGLND